MARWILDALNPGDGRPPQAPGPPVPPGASQAARPPDEQSTTPWCYARSNVIQYLYYLMNVTSLLLNIIFEELLCSLDEPSLNVMFSIHNIDVERDAFLACQVTRYI